MTRLRFLRRAALSASGVLVAVACSVSGGSDSETHFACSADGACRSLGSGFKCVGGYCQPASPAPSPSELGKPGFVPDGGGPGGPAPAGGGPIVEGPDGVPVAPASDGGPVEPGPWGKPLENRVTINGTISIPAGMTVSMADLRVALVWRVYGVSGLGDPECVPYGNGNELYSGAAVTDIRVDEKGHFTFDMTEAPAYEAFHHPPFPLRDDGANIAYGVILVYEDGDHDGRLDFQSVSQSSADVALGTSDVTGLDRDFVGYSTSDGLGPSDQIAYSDLEVVDMVPLAPGFTIVHLGKSGFEALPTESEIRIVLSDPMDVHALICKKLCMTADARDCPARIGDVLPGGVRECNPSSYYWTGLTCIGCVCTRHVCTYPIGPTDPIPEAWPCAQASSDAGP